MNAENAYYLAIREYLKHLYGSQAYEEALQNYAQIMADYDCMLSGATNAKVKLNLGSGKAALSGFINVDIVAGIDVEVADLTKPWPWEDSSVDYIRASHVIEHLPDKIFTMNELWRVLKGGARVDIVVPTTDGPAAWQDPTHVSYWNRRSFFYYEAGSPYRELSARQYQVKAKFRTVKEFLSSSLDGPILSITLEAVKSEVTDTITRENGETLAGDASDQTIELKTAGTTRNTSATLSELNPRQSAEADAYLHVLKRTLTRFPLGQPEQLMVLTLRDVDPRMTRPLRHWANRSRSIYGTAGLNPIWRASGMDWPREAETMIGLYRLDNIEFCVRNVLKRGVPGDLAETGVWRGGASIFMRAVIKAYGDIERKVWLIDSFQGLPKPDARYPADADSDLWTFPELAVPVQTVKANFARYGLLDRQVRFLEGWFSDTLPTAPIERLAVLRLDGDMYESTMVALQSLYHKVSPGGFVIVDDYNAIPACRQAVDDFRAERDVVEPLCPIDWTGVYWQVNPPPNARVNAASPNGAKRID